MWKSSNDEKEKFDQTKVKETKVIQRNEGYNLIDSCHKDHLGKRIREIIVC